eukprot:1315219-Karenia_brevis.AAC.1
MIKAGLKLTCWNGAIVSTHTGREKLEAPDAMLIMNGPTHRRFSIKNITSFYLREPAKFGSARMIGTL